MTSGFSKDYQEMLNRMKTEAEENVLKAQTANREAEQRLQECRKVEQALEAKRDKLKGKFKEGMKCLKRVCKDNTTAQRMQIAIQPFQDYIETEDAISQAKQKREEAEAKAISSRSDLERAYKEKQAVEVLLHTEN